MRWYLKCVLDNVKGLLPGQSMLRRLKRRVCKYSPFPERADYAIDEGIRLIQFIRSTQDIRNRVCLEIGAGWEPLIPILFCLCGAKKVITTDLHRLCSDATFAMAIAGLRRNKARIVSDLGLDADFVEAQLAWNEGERMERGLERFGIEYMAPCDCASLPLPNASVDIIYSRSVLEHIPPSIIRNILQESRRVLTPSGLVCHFVDCSDHWEHFDKNISRINFLQYSDELFRLTHLNALNYHNRLRHSEYVELLVGTDFSIIKEDRLIDTESLRLLRTSMKVDRRYKSFDHEDLATVDSFLLGSKS